MNKEKKQSRMAEHWKRHLLIAVLAVVLGVGCMLGFGLTGHGALNLGADLGGGTLIDVTVGTALTEENYDDVVKIATDLLDELGFRHLAGIRPTGEFGSEYAGFAVTGRVTAAEGQTREEAVEAFNSGLIGSVDEGTGLRNQIYNYLDQNKAEGQTINRMNITVHSSQTESSVPWQQLLYFGLTVLGAAVVICVYLWIRFEFRTGLFVVLGMVHDVLIMLCLAAVVRVQITADIVGVTVAVLACSLLGSVVVFDRIRENSRRLRLQEPSPVGLVNTSVAETRPRSLLTALFILLLAVALGAFGGEAIRSFMICLVLGLVGTLYSSLCLIPSLWARVQEGRLKKGKSTKLFHEFKRKEKPAQETAAE